MNFVGHAFLCGQYTHLIAGNLAGDSYKGNLDNFTHLPKHILDGVKLHRFIDDFTDQSAPIVEAAHLLQQKGIARVSYIACDILVDHYLSKNWEHYSNQPYYQFLDLVYLEIEKNLKGLEPDFQFLFDKMKEYNWMHGYPTEMGIRTTLFQFGKRIRFKNDLHLAMDIYLSEKTTFDNLFKTFLSDIKAATGDFILEKQLNIS